MSIEIEDDVTTKSIEDDVIKNISYNSDVVIC